MPVVTPSPILNALLVVFGIAVLIKGSDWLIDGAAGIARHYRIPDAIIGLTLVSVGTSLPELATNIYAAITNQAGVAMGNVTGSNITNVLLVLGVAAVCAGVLETNRTMFRRDCTIMLASYAVFTLFCLNAGQVVGRIEGMLLCAGFLWYVFMLFSRRPKVADEEISAPDMNKGKACLYILIGVAVVPLGAKLMVDNVVWYAERWHVPQAAISALVIALGTSLPELAVTVRGVMKKQNDISMGNIVGSNIFNLLLVMGTTAIIRPVGVDASVLHVILPAMLISGVLMALFMRTGWRLVRWEGAVFLAGYLGFVLLTIL